MTQADSHVFPARRFLRKQRVHFLVCHLLPLTAVVLLPIWGLAIRIDWSGIVLLLGMWMLTGGVGVSVGYHRHFAHRAFKACTPLRYMIAFCGGMAGQGSVMYWVALHRRHHSLSDLPGDPHSPRQEASQLGSRWRSFLRGHMGWTIRHDVPKPSRYTRELMVDPVAIWSARIYPMAVMAGIALPALLGAVIHDELKGMIQGAYWGGCVRLVAGHHLIWSINSVCHASGSRPYNMPDQSGNVAWLAWMTFGEGWHNNHHAFPTSARLGLHRLQMDLGWRFICFCRAVGLVSGVREAEPAAAPASPSSP